MSKFNWSAFWDGFFGMIRTLSPLLIGAFLGLILICGFKYFGVLN